MYFTIFSIIFTNFLLNARYECQTHYEYKAEGRFRQVNPQLPAPKFVNKMKDLRVQKGKSVELVCTIENIGPYSMSWIHADTVTVLSIGDEKLTNQEHIWVKRENNSHLLGFTAITEADEGQYICQINVLPVLNQFVRIHVQVSPDIVPFLTSADTRIVEGETLVLRCVGTGKPHPKVVWRRNDHRPIIIEKNRSLDNVTGSRLTIANITTQASGAYLCLMNNGLYPGVSKTINVQVLHKPRVSVYSRMLGVRKGEAIILECIVDANPRPREEEIFWIKDGSIMFGDVLEGRNANDSYVVTEVIEPTAAAATTAEAYYHTTFTLARLTISEVKNDSYGEYTCVAKNKFGSGSAIVQLRDVTGEETEASSISINRRNSISIRFIEMAICLLVFASPTNGLLYA